jgi:8-oxo-dGTP pyrophosphatase MutT (NUDIX family)
MRQVSLSLLIKKSDEEVKEILLAMKKRGFGAGRWNGVGGKPDLEKNETIEQCAIREAEEEVGVRIKKLERFAIMDFHFSEAFKEKNWDQQVHLFLSDEWEGEPIETEEMRPQWFSPLEIPYDEMWDDDKFWLPSVLDGKKLRADFFFDENQKIINKRIDFIETFENFGFPKPFQG